MISEERPQKRRRGSTEDDTLSFFDDLQSSPIRLGRSFSHREPQFTFESPTQASASLFRSQSQKLPPRKMVGAHRNVTITRGRSGKYKNRLRPQSAVLTSTPKRRRVLKPVSSKGSFTAESINPGVEVTPTKSGNPVQFDLDLAEETFGLDGLTVASDDACSDMDISFD